jgi:hypothetical protein
MRAEITRTELRYASLDDDAANVTWPSLACCGEPDRARLPVRRQEKGSDGDVPGP